MSNYTQSTNFATKDSLASGDPLKIVKGTEINTEFVNISTAIATKADLASPTFTGTPAAPTASSGTNTTQLATTAFVTAALASSMSALFPVGSIYTAVVSTNPATLLGFGTWTAFGAGRVLAGFASGDPQFGTAEGTGGSRDLIVPTHNHTATSTVTDPTHQHGASSGNFLTETGSGSYAYGGVGANISVVTNTASVSTGVTVATTVASSGQSAADANIQPFITVYFWKRTV